MKSLKSLLPLLMALGLILSGCHHHHHHHDKHHKHHDGPGHSEDAPGHNKHKHKH
jgi:hypothetical protein